MKITKIPDRVANVENQTKKSCKINRNRGVRIGLGSSMWLEYFSLMSWKLRNKKKGKMYALHWSLAKAFKLR